LSDKVNESTIGAATTYLWPVITDQPTCPTARMNKQYACAANSDCWDDGNRGYYSCFCSNANYVGNPYVVGPGGCYSGKYCSSNGDVALRNQFMNLHVHICVFLFIFNLIPPAKYILSFAIAFYSSLQTSYHNFLKTQNKCTHFNFIHVCTLTHVNPHTNTPRFTHLDIHMYTYHWDITHSILEYSYAQDSKSSVNCPKYPQHTILEKRSLVPGRMGHQYRFCNRYCKAEAKSFGLRHRVKHLIRLSLVFLVNKIY